LPTQIFDYDKFYRLLVEWMVASNQPFTEVDNPQFRKMMAFLRPNLRDNMVHSTQIRKKIDAGFDEARKRFKAAIKVSIDRLETHIALLMKHTHRQPQVKSQLLAMRGLQRTG
jgi:hypothetical protein